MAAGFNFEGAVKAHPSGYRLYDLDYPYIQVIEKSLFYEVWKAIRENNHEEIRRLKTEHPELTIYSGYHKSRILGRYFKDGVVNRMGEINTLLTEFSEQTIVDSTVGKGKWTTTYSTHQLLFDLGFIQRDDSYVIWKLLHFAFVLEEKETAFEFVSCFMDAEAVRKSAFHWGTNEHSDIYSWKRFIGDGEEWTHRRRNDDVDIEGLHRVFRLNAVDLMIAPYLVVGNDFIEYRHDYGRDEDEGDDEDDAEDDE